MNVHQVNATNQQPVTVTEAAVVHFKKQLAKKEGAIGIRLNIVPAGCSGYRYEVNTIDDEHPIANTESVFSIPLQEDLSKDMLFCAPKKILPMLMGTVIDYAKKGLSGELVFNNPQQTGACGCGESITFSSLDGEEAK